MLGAASTSCYLCGAQNEDVRFGGGADIALPQADTDLSWSSRLRNRALGKPGLVNHCRPREKGHVSNVRLQSNECERWHATQSELEVDAAKPLLADLRCTIHCLDQC